MQCCIYVYSWLYGTLLESVIFGSLIFKPVFILTQKKNYLITHMQDLETSLSVHSEFWRPIFWCWKQWHLILSRYNGKFTFASICKFLWKLVIMDTFLSKLIMKLLLRMHVLLMCEYTTQNRRKRAEASTRGSELYDQSSWFATKSYNSRS